MKSETLHDWRVSTPEAIAIQKRLAGLVSKTDAVTPPRFVAGLDISVDKPIGTAAVVVLNYPELELIEVQTATGRLEFPYVPGLLSFREAPLTIAVCEKLTTTPDLFLVDGQGYAHPRRMGIACHLGLLLKTPTIGCAKSLLCGAYEMPGAEAGSFSDITDCGEVIGAAVRTRTGIKPVFVSIGHKISLPSAITWVRNCCRKYRLPEPSRLAHLAATGQLNKAAVGAGL